MALRATAKDLRPSPTGTGAGGEGAFVRVTSLAGKAATLRSARGQAPGRHYDRACSSLRITTLPATRRDQAARIWAGLLDQSGTDELTSSWTWIATWLDAYGADVPHRFLVATDSHGTPVAITLATTGQRQRRGRLPVRTAHLGTAGEGGLGGVYVEYNRILALPGHRAAALQAFTDQLTEPRWRIWPRVDIVELNGFAPEELDGWDATGFTLDTHVCRIVDLDAIRASSTPLDKVFGGQIGRKLRKNTRWFTERHGPVASEWITDPDRGQQAFTELVDLHQARWLAAGEPGSFASAPLLRFHRALIDALLPLGRIVMVRVTAGERLVGVSYSFNEHGALNHYQWGLMDVGPDENSLSPGFITAHALLSEALERGYREVNWLGGDARWKRELSTTTKELVWAERAASPWAHVVRGALAAKPIVADGRARANALLSNRGRGRQLVPALAPTDSPGRSDAPSDGEPREP